MYLQKLKLLARALLATCLIPTTVDACWQMSVPAPYLRVSFGFGGKETKIGEEGNGSIASFCTRSVMLLKLLREKLKKVSLSAEHVGLFFQDARRACVIAFSRRKWSYVALSAIRLGSIDLDNNVKKY